MEEDIQKQIDQAVKGNDIIIFMKGTPTAPQCGFSAATVDVFNMLNVPYQSVNVLEDMSVREGIKQYTNWPTIPQVFVRGEFIGGCDIVQEMYANGELNKIVDGIAAG